MGFTLEHKFAATPEALRDILPDIFAELDRRHCPCGELTELRLALEEALINAWEHGSQRDPSKAICVRTEWDEAEGLLITIRDEGPGFEPESIPDPTDPTRRDQPRGRGLYLMRELMDEVEFRDGGREVRLLRRPRKQA